MVQKGLCVANYQAKRTVNFRCGSTSISQCTNQILYGTTVTPNTLGYTDPNTLDYIASAGFTGYWNGTGLYS
jgi:hypothetical protein